MVTKESFEAYLVERHSLEVHEKVSKAVVGIAGLGGLGSNIALDLARIGVGKLVLVDFDCVELSNINRQAYFIEHIGMKKVMALEQLIRKVNPFVVLETHNVRVNRENTKDLFSTVDIVVEAFDNPPSKVALTETILMEGKKPLVAASGMAGALSSNSIVSRKVRNGFYLCGDGVTDSSQSNGLMAPRVHVASSHQANMVLRLILGETEVDDNTRI